MVIEPYITHQPKVGSEAEYDLAVIQDNVSRVFDVLTDQPILDGNMLSDIALTTATSEVAHKLDRDYVGWMVVDNVGNAVVYRDDTTTTDKTKFISMTASATTTIKLWVF